MRIQQHEDIEPAGAGVQYDGDPQGVTPGSLPTETNPEPDMVQRRALSGVLSLVGREAAVRAMSLVGALVLAWLLTPVEYGLFGIATFVVGIATLFSELGLGAAFIRRKEEVTSQELNAMFTLQLAFVSTLAVVLFLSAPIIAGLYDTPAVEWLIRALAVNVIVTSLRSVPVVVAERKLDYRPIAMSDVVGQLSYWLVAISGALLGLGVWSLVLAVLASGVSGTLAIYSRTSWRPAFNFNWKPLKESIRFGLLYQSQSVASFVKDTMVPALGGPVFGAVAVGYLTWAMQLTAMPLVLAHLVSRVSYSALGRLQHDPKAFITMLEAALGWTCRLSLPVFAVLVGLAPNIIEHIFTPKWLPALPSLYLLTINMVLSIGMGIMVAALYSLGRRRPVLRITLGWTTVTWLAAALLIAVGFGFEAIAGAYAAGAIMVFPVMVLELRDLGGVRLLRPAVLSLLSATAGGGALYFARPWVVDIWSLLVVAGVSSLAMWTTNLWPVRRTVLDTARSRLMRPGDRTAGTGNEARGV